MNIMSMNFQTFPEYYHAHPLVGREGYLVVFHPNFTTAVAPPNATFEVANSIPQ